MTNRRSSASRTRSAFTLIELLVVIAIIAILAAILFPVFAQARAKARQTACLSNMKQISLAMLQYMSDYDGFVPTFRNQTKFVFSGSTYGAYASASKLTGTYWTGLLQPYESSYDIYKCPSSYDASMFGTNTNPGVWQLGAQYGINGDYLYNTYVNGQCASIKYAPDDTAYNPVAGMATSKQEAQIVSPSRTVMLAEHKTLIAVTASSGPGSVSLSYYSATQYVASPANVQAPDCCPMLGGVGWGSDDSYEALSSAFGGTGYPGNTNSAGGFSSRHNGGGNISFMDGHTKWFTTGGAAAGTSWTATTTQANVAITDTKSYMWDNNY